MSRRIRTPTRPRRRIVGARHYAVARHRETGLIWVFAFVSDVLVGACGPMVERPPTSLLPHLCFDEPWARLDVPIIRARIAEFDRLD